jgi:hypothetical protein
MLFKDINFLECNMVLSSSALEYYEKGPVSVTRLPDSGHQPGTVDACEAVVWLP